MNYTEVVFSFEPYENIYPDLLTASLGEIGFDSFRTEGELLFAYIPSSTYSKKRTEIAVSSFFIPDVDIKFCTKEIKEHNWNEEWEKNEYEPIIISDLCTIHAPHHTNLPHARYNILIQPKMSFGSGAHETTSMLTETLLNMDLKDKNTLDMGCGTGILAIAMSMRGAKKVTAVDIDKNCVENTQENCNLNKLTNIESVCGDISVIKNQKNTFDIIVANIHKNIILNDMELYAKLLSSNGILMVSGFYLNDAEDIELRAHELGLSLVESNTKNDWCALTFRAQQ